MVNSMTGFATKSGATQTASWAWEIRSVNGKGFDLRVRLPEGTETLEKPLKSAVSATCSRGTVSVSLRVKQASSDGVPELNEAALEAVLNAAETTKEKSKKRDLDVGPLNIAEVLAIKSVLTYNAGDENSDWIAKAKSQITTLASDFQAARADEGAALESVLSQQIQKLKHLSADAKKAAKARKVDMAEDLRTKVAEVLQDTDLIDENRMEQELAVLIVKSDITEELDRLNAHIDAATDLLNTDGPIGRKFDFLMQEFNREANTLCAKSGNKELTRIGLDLKTVIDQMREQVQNVE